ncbi:MAG: FtsX-like permease family protein [Clostridia bacterium]|nr:FtsX-like permease family protein [Clostridia bacterium]
MGASGLKTKPIRLIFTILVAVFSFALFGLVSTLMMYDANYTAATALEASILKASYVYKNYHCTRDYGDKVYETTYSTLMSTDDLEKLNNSSLGLDFAGVFNFEKESDEIHYLDLIKTIKYYPENEVISNGYNSDRYYNNIFKGFSDCGEEYVLRNFPDSAIGNSKYPTNSNEIAISKYAFDVIAYYCDYEEAEDIIGKTLRIEMLDSSEIASINLKVTGVYDFGEISPKFNSLKTANDFNLANDYIDYMDNSFHKIGFVSSDFYSFYYDTLIETNTIYPDNYSQTKYVKPQNRKYSFAITPIESFSIARSSYILNFNKIAEDDSFFVMDNDIYNTSVSISSVIEMLELIFLVVGSALAVLSALFLFNFISVSISNKSKEVGILRAVGARGMDVFKIFFIESLMICLMCFIISSIVAGVASMVINGILLKMLKIELAGINILHLGILNIAIILGIALVVSVIATILPVYFVSRKSPVESIRAL